MMFPISFGHSSNIDKATEESVNVVSKTTQSTNEFVAGTDDVVIKMLFQKEKKALETRLKEGRMKKESLFYMVKYNVQKIMGNIK